MLNMDILDKNKKVGTIRPDLFSLFGELLW